jgi:predicted branched-subunit amino acid permease
MDIDPHPDRPARRTTRHEAFRAGFRRAAGAPAAVLFAGMLGFGALGRSHGLDPWLVTLCSLLVYAIPGQLVLVEMVLGGASWLTTALAVTLTSGRFVTMVVTLFPQLHRRDRNRALYGWVHFLAMTPWAISMREFQSLPPRHRRSFYAGASLTCMAVALPGTWIGYQLSGLLPPPVTLALVFLNPLFFLLSFLEVRSRANQLAIALGCLLAPVLFFWHAGSSLITTGLIAGTLAYGLDRYWRTRCAGTKP